MAILASLAATPNIFAGKVPVFGASTPPVGGQVPCKIENDDKFLFGHRSRPPFVRMTYTHAESSTRKQWNWRIPLHEVAETADPMSFIAVPSTGHKSRSDSSFIRLDDVGLSQSHVRNGYETVTDEFGRITEVPLQRLRLDEDFPRDGYTTEVGHAVRGPGGGDAGFHLIGRQFGGVSEAANLVPANSALNNGAYKALEARWAKALNETPPVDIRIMIEVKYNPGNTSIRPDEFVVRWTENNVPMQLSFQNP